MSQGGSNQGGPPSAPPPIPRRPSEQSVPTNLPSVPQRPKNINEIFQTPQTSLPTQPLNQPQPIQPQLQRPPVQSQPNQIPPVNRTPSQPLQQPSQPTPPSNQPIPPRPAKNPSQPLLQQPFQSTPQSVQQIPLSSQLPPQPARPQQTQPQVVNQPQLSSPSLSNQSLPSVGQINNINNINNGKPLPSQLPPQPRPQPIQLQSGISKQNLVGQPPQQNVQVNNNNNINPLPSQLPPQPLRPSPVQSQSTPQLLSQQQSQQPHQSLQQSLQQGGSQHGVGMQQGVSTQGRTGGVQPMGIQQGMGTQQGGAGIPQESVGMQQGVGIQQGAGIPQGSVGVGMQQGMGTQQGGARIPQGSVGVGMQQGMVSQQGAGIPQGSVGVGMQSGMGMQQGIGMQQGVGTPLPNIPSSTSKPLPTLTPSSTPSQIANQPSAPQLLRSVPPPQSIQQTQPPSQLPSQLPHQPARPLQSNQPQQSIQPNQQSSQPPLQSIQPNQQPPQLGSKISIGNDQANLPKANQPQSTQPLPTQSASQSSNQSIPTQPPRPAKPSNPSLLQNPVNSSSPSPSPQIINPSIPINSISSPALSTSPQNNPSPSLKPIPTPIPTSTPSSNPSSSSLKPTSAPSQPPPVVRTNQPSQPTPQPLNVNNINKNIPNNNNNNNKVAKINNNINNNMDDEDEIKSTPFAPFELILFIRNIPCRSRIVTSMEVKGDRAYFGTQDGSFYIYSFSLSDGLYESKVENYVTLSSGLPIDKIEIVPEFVSIILFSGGQLHILNMFSLEVSSVLPQEVGTVRAIGEIMGATSYDRSVVLNYSLQKPSESSFRICCQVKGALLFYEILGSKGEITKPYFTLNLADYQQGPMIAWTQRRCFLGNQKEYFMFDVPTGKSQVLFTMENSQPHILVLNNDILLVHGIVGIFVDFAGKITRGSITWSSPPRSITYHSPYLLTLLADRIEVHNINNQKLVQSVTFPQKFRGIGGTQLPVLADRDIIYAMRPIPVEDQLEVLVYGHKLEEAIQLANSIYKPEISDDLIKLREFNGMVGIALFCQLKFDQANQYLFNSSFDIRELIILFQNLIPISNLAPKFTSRFEFKINFNENNELIFKLALLNILERKYSRALLPPILMWIEIAMLKLYLEIDEEKVVKIMGTRNIIPLDEAENALKNYPSSSHWLSRVYSAQKSFDLSLSLLQQIGMKEIEVVDIEEMKFNVVEEAINILINCDNPLTSYQHGRWLFLLDPKLSLLIFTSPNKKAKFEAEEVLEYLKSYGKLAIISYLEYLIFVDQNEDENIHNRMALLCLELLSSSLNNNNNLNVNNNNNIANENLPGGKRRGRAAMKAPSNPSLPSSSPDQEIDYKTILEIRSKLLNLLKFSTKYNAATLLGRITDEMALYEESVLLHSRMNNHEEALNILVQKIQDFNAADEYCEQHRDKNNNLFFALLKLYLSSSSSSGDSIPPNAFLLLNARAKELDPLIILKLLPDDIPLHKITEYLTKSYQQSISEMRMKMVERNLCKMEQLIIKTKLQNTLKSCVVVEDETLCRVCGKPIGNMVFTVYPNGVFAHLSCSKNKNVCPITGRDFNKHPVDLV